MEKTSKRKYLLPFYSKILTSSIQPFQLHLTLERLEVSPMHNSFIPSISQHNQLNLIEFILRKLVCFWSLMQSMNSNTQQNLDLSLPKFMTSISVLSVLPCKNSENGPEFENHHHWSLLWPCISSHNGKTSGTRKEKQKNRLFLLDHALGPLQYCNHSHPCWSRPLGPVMVACTC